MKRFAWIVLIPLIAACGGSDELVYQPRRQILPPHINKIALRPVRNKTQQFGLEDKLILAIRDEFLRNGEYRILPENLADGILQVSITRYILVPTQFDSVLTPTVYKLRILMDLDFIDRAKNQIIWTEPNLEGVYTYNAPTVTGGITEEQARELIWDQVSRDIVTRVVRGFGTVTGTSLREISRDAPPGETTDRPIKPVIQTPY